MTKLFNPDDKSTNPVEPTVEPAPEPVEPNASPDYTAVLAEITNEEGNPKYSDVESALKSIPHAQSHIKTIEEENASLKEELQKRTTAEELLEKIKTNGASTNASTESLSPEQISLIVNKAIEGREAASIASANQAKVVEALKEKYGDKAEEVYVATGKKFGLGSDTLDDLSGRSPDAVLALFPEVDGGPQHTSGGLNTNGFQSTKPVDVDKDVFKRAAGPCSTGDSVAAWREAGKLIEVR